MKNSGQILDVEIFYIYNYIETVDDEALVLARNWVLLLQQGFFC